MYGGGRVVSDAAVNSRIRSARLAIRDDGKEQRLIRTVHGRGFRFIGETVAKQGPTNHGLERAGGCGRR